MKTEKYRKEQIVKFTRGEKSSDIFGFWTHVEKADRLVAL